MTVQLNYVNRLQFYYIDLNVLQDLLYKLLQTFMSIHLYDVSFIDMSLLTHFRLDTIKMILIPHKLM